MKTVVIILIVLIVMNVVYGISNEARIFWQDYETCVRTLGVSNEPRIDIVLCTMIRDGEILHSNGEYNSSQFLKKIRALISDPIRLQQAYEIFFRCDNEAIQAGAVGLGKTIRFLLCGLPILRLYDTQ